MNSLTQREYMQSSHILEGNNVDYDLTNCGLIMYVLDVHSMNNGNRPIFLRVISLTKS